MPPHSARLARIAWMALLLLGCSSSTPTGTTTGCAKDTDCASGRVCERGTCVAEATSSGGPGGPGGPGQGADGGADGPINEGSDIFCSRSATLCSCGHSADHGSERVCRSSDVGSPALCCGDPNWPASGTCLCAQRRCGQVSFGDKFCSCSAAAVDGNKTEVASCSEGVCCSDPKFEICSCRVVSGFTCPPGQTVVPSCSAAAIQCSPERKRVDACAGG